MSTTIEKCDKPATAAVKVAGSSEFIPACEAHIYGHRAIAARAGKKSVPKGLKKDEVAAFTGANRDDVSPIQVRPLTAVEREMKTACFNHLIPKGE